MTILVLLWVPYIVFCQFKNNLKCYYEYDDKQLELDTSKPQIKMIEIQALATDGHTNGFGFWSKYIAYIDINIENTFYKPFDDPICQTEVCKFNGFYFLKLLDENQLNFAAIILNMNDNPISLTHEIYLFDQNSEIINHASINFEASQYEAIWYYTSILYSSNDQNLRFFTNYNNQLVTFQYQIMTEKITIILGGYKNDLSQNFVNDQGPLLYFKGHFSPIQEYVSFLYNEQAFNIFFSQCPFQIQKTIQDKSDILRQFDSSSFENDLELSFFLFPTKNSRYTIQCWIKQNYIKAFEYYLKNQEVAYYQLEQSAFSLTQPYMIDLGIKGEQLLDFYYSIDFQNNNQTVIHFKAEFIKIPLAIPQYQDEEQNQYNTLAITKDYLYDKTQQWHFVVIDQGRNAVNGAKMQIRFYFVNEQPLIYYLGTQNQNSQFSGSVIQCTLLFREMISMPKSKTLFGSFVIITGQQEDNNDGYQCDSSCKDCNGPTRYHCISCQTELNYFLTQFNSCECLYLNEYNEKTQKCDPIEISQNFIITKEDLIEQNCQFGYFLVLFKNQYFCIQCPQYHETGIFCGNCFHESFTWYIKPICTFDYLQEQSTYAYIKYQRSSIDVDIYYIDNEMELQLLEGASEFCEPTQLGCQFSMKFHLGTQIRMKCKTNRYYDSYQCQTCVRLCIICQSKDICLNCIENHYFNYQSKICQPCPKECKTCQNAPENDFGYKCLTCQEQYTLNHQGQCKQCGIYCQYCQEDLNIKTQEYFIRCLKCIDTKIMSIRFNGIDCKIVIIPNCQYGFLVSKSDYFGYNAFDYNFQPSNDLSDEKSICALCQDKLSYQFDIDICIDHQEYMSCYIGLISNFILEGVDYGVLPTCLISNQHQAITVIGDLCTNSQTNCYWCYTKKIKSNAYCLQCLQGYYSSRLTGQCQLCPENLHCKTCYHSTIGYNDEWKKNIVLFINFLRIQTNVSYFFWNQDQSQNLDDYEIICTSCYFGYVLKNNKCIKYCDQSCQSCVFIDDQYICQFCSQNIYHNLLSLVDNQCSICPSYCLLCRQRTENEIKILNSLFVQNQKNRIYTYQCLKPFQNQETLSYDTIFGQFIPCQNSQICQNVVNYELNLYCSEQDYQTQFQLIEDPDLKNSFKKKNVLFSELLQQNQQGNSFSIFEDDAIYDIMNRKNIKKIQLILKSNIDQVCSIPQLSYITQSFSKNVFSAIDIQLIMKSVIETELKVIIYEELQFIDFTLLRFENVEFIIQSNIYHKKVNAQSFKEIEMQLQKVVVSTTSLEVSTFISFQFFQLNKISFNQVIIKNLNMNNNRQKSFFQFEFQSKQKISIQIEDFSILNSIIENTNILEFKSIYIQSVSFNQIKINSNFRNTSLISLINDNVLEQIKVTNFTQQGKLQDSEPFFLLDYALQTIIEKIDLKNLDIIDSTFLQLERSGQINYFSIYNCFSHGQASFINNNRENQLAKQISLTYKINNLDVKNLISSSNSQVLYFQAFNSITSEIIIKNIAFEQIIINEEETILNQQLTYLIYIQLQNAIIQSCNIIRGLGISEFIFVNLQSLQITDLQATQPQILLLHQYYDCSNIFQSNTKYPNLIKLFDVKNVKFEDFKITRLNFVNSALISYTKQQKTSSSNRDNFEIKDFLIKNNIIITSQKDASASLISIISNQMIYVEFKYVEFNNNWLHNYQQNLLKASAVALLINSPSGIIKIKQSKVYNNFATNTTESVINIISEQIIFDNIQFINNSNQNVQRLLLNIDWQFPQNMEINENNLKSIFQYKNAYGNSYLEADLVVIQNSQIQNSQGLNGVGLYINAQIVKLINLQFLNLTTFFKYNEENGGCIFIKIPISGCKIEIQNIIAQNIITKDYGSFLFIQSNHDKLNLTINNLTLTECISKKGSAFYAAFQKNSLQNLIRLKNIIIKNQQVALLNYLKQILNNQIVLLDLNNRVLIYVENAVLFLEDILIEKIFRESFLESLDQGNITINQITITDGTPTRKNTILIQPREDLSTTILIMGVQFKNFKQYEDEIQEICEIQQITYKINNMQCSSKANSNVKQLILDDQKDQEEQIKCLYQKIQFTNITNQQSVIAITSIKSNDLIVMIGIHLYNNDYSKSVCGLIYLQINKKPFVTFSIVIQDLMINNNFCGKAGCLYINSDVFDQTSTLQTQNRLLTSNPEQNLQILNHDLTIQNYQCFENVADFGTCLFSNQTNLIILNSIFFNNQAIVIGGAMYFCGNQSFQFIVNCNVFNNSAYIAGAIYFQDSLRQDIKKFNSLVIDNQASYFGQNIVQTPTHLSITLNNYRYIYDTFIVEKTIYNLVESINNTEVYQQNVIFLPSGTPIKQYKKFNKNTELLESQNLTFRIVALDDQNFKLNNLTNSKCFLEAFIFDIEKNKVQENQDQKLLSQKTVSFDSNTNDYNLDDLIIYFDSENTNKTYLQLVITCTSIQIPQYDENNVIIQSFHNNYKLFVNINTFKCRVGEIKSLQDYSCHECDPTLDQYSNQLNLNKCYIRDEQSTINVTSFGLNLRLGFWRPYFDNNFIEECQNLKENCLGEWNYGDSSCYMGHIGALCEQCDIKNIRGNGYFSQSQQYSCGSCENINYNAAQIMGFSIWSLITIILSVKGANSAQNQQFQFSNIIKSAYSIESPYLIKILTNYLQIISSLTTFKLSLPVNFFNFLNGVGNPIQHISYSMDCFLIEMSDLDIHYIRLIWQLLLPCVYFTILSIIYSMLIYTEYVKYKGPIVMTALIYMYIYFQPSIIGSFIALISTRRISDIPWIQANVAFRFDTSIHLKWVLYFCIPFLFLFGILIPLGMLLSLFQIRNKLIYKRGKSLLGYLYYEYKPKAYFWEIVKIITKELLILALIYYEDSIIIKGSLIYFILLSYWSLNLKYQPFISARLNQLDYQTTIICEVSIIIGIALNMGYEEQFFNLSILFFFTLLIINIFILTKLLIYIFNAYMNEMEKTVDLIKSKIHQSLPLRLKMNHFCLRILRPRIESRQRAKQNFQKLKLAFKKFQAKKKQSVNVFLYNSLNSQQTSQRINTFTNREIKQSQFHLLSQVKSQSPRD
ncbi:unnamed protein product [Paramecium sonneborni]|uniref:Transmembrane protein n=1 Tax=Paramecium sonneborni TaxID=65129 RepID=A0A8S1QF52_9CILI|nr:unnamed protein product [Paramecium sonneborni]